MTPAARIAAAADVLDRILAGQAPEPALVNWGRASRFAGSGDRAAVRDLVFDALRCRRSFAALGGGLSGRGLMLGRLRALGQDPAGVFTGTGHALAPLTPADEGRTPVGAEALDCPEWLESDLRQSLGADFEPVLRALQTRAPVFLRVNTARTTVPKAIAALAGEGIVAQPHPLAKTALEVTGNKRKIQTSQTYLTGLVELQDASSQAVAEAVPLSPGHRVLDLCAGGGGKTLALAARGGITLHAHDANPGRLRDLGPRAERAGAAVTIVENPERSAPYDVILTDVPCSGSGSWRRDPAGKWALTADRLAETRHLQATILDRAAALLSPGGVLAYATCALLQSENEDQVAAFLGRHPGWTCRDSRRFTPLQGGDGFFLALLSR